MKIVAVLLSVVCVPLVSGPCPAAGQNPGLPAGASNGLRHHGLPAGASNGLRHHGLPAGASSGLRHHGLPAGARSGPHPAVVRVTVPDGGGSFSMGSGTFVAVEGSRGLVVTNWHVVRDAQGAPMVTFPDGFRSAAVVARIDRDWDLAALVIWRPRAEPVPLSPRPPQPGEPLWIAGYGGGRYRMATGRCTQYVSPGGGHAFEMVELSTPARQGDSGGPIFNRRGELAGVLFGSAAGTTSGSYCGRVDRFLTPVVARLEQLERATPESDGEQLIASRESRPAAPVASIRAPSPSAVAEETPAFRPGLEGVSGDTPEFRPGVEGALRETPAFRPGLGGALRETPADSPPLLWDRIETLLAAIGVLAIVAQIIRLLGRAVDG